MEEKKDSMKEVTLEELLEAGCHFGHQVTRQNPKARDFVFEARDNIHIIDLAKTKEGLEAAAAFIKEQASKAGSTMLVLGTKRQARDIIRGEVKRAHDTLGEGHGLFFVTSRWIGGTLTNFDEVAKNFKRLKDLTARLASDVEKAKHTKKEVGLWERARTNLEGFYGGIVDMRQRPDTLFIIDTHLEDLAVREAAKTGVTTVGIVDTNADPTAVDYPIPANDDAVGSIKLIASYIMDAWIEGRKSQESGIRNQESGGEEPSEETTKETKPEKLAAKKSKIRTKKSKKP